MKKHCILKQSWRKVNKSLENCVINCKKPFMNKINLRFRNSCSCSGKWKIDSKPFRFQKRQIPDGTCAWYRSMHNSGLSLKRFCSTSMAGAEKRYTIALIPLSWPSLNKIFQLCDRNAIAILYSISFYCIFSDLNPSTN